MTHASTSIFNPKGQEIRLCILFAKSYQWSVVGCLTGGACAASDGADDYDAQSVAPG